MITPLVKALDLTMDEFNTYVKFFKIKYYQPLYKVIFLGEPYGHDPDISHQAIRAKLLRLYKLKYRVDYRSGEVGRRAKNKS